jgi:hypothetical protein
MKQIQKTPEVMDKLRSAYGPDADLSNLAVFETVAMNTQPLRKTSGLFKNARLGLSLLSESAASANKESIPVNQMHGDEALPVGRFFNAQVVNADGGGDEMRGWMAIDASISPATVQGLNSGTIDQVSVGQMNKSISCNMCGFDFMGPDSSMMNVWDATCNDGHVMGTDGAYALIDGLQSFFELSLVGKGAVNGAKIVGPTDAKLTNNEPLRLAASTSKVGALRLTCSTSEELQPVSAELFARLEAQAGETATLSTQLAAVTVERDGLTTSLAAVTAERDTHAARIVELEPLAARAEEGDAALAAAVEHLTGELKTVLTACGKPHENLPTDVAALTASIKEHRAAFAGVVPVDGKAKPAADPGKTELAAAPTNSAFRAPR